MGRSVVSETRVLKYLQSVSAAHGVRVGLVLGQSSSNRDYVVHLAVYKLPDDDSGSEEESSLRNVKDIDESWVCDHAKYVTRMLPGGMWVLGVFVCSHNDPFNDNASKLKSIIMNMHNCLKENTLLYADSSSSEKLLLHFNSNSKKYVCKSLDVLNPGSPFKPAELKFKESPLQWYQISSYYKLNEKGIYGILSEPFDKPLKDVLNKLKKSMEVSVIRLNGIVRNDSDSIESIFKKEKLLDGGNTLNAKIYIPYFDDGVKEEKKEQVVDFELHLHGVVSSSVYVNDRATVRDAVIAVRQDIIRSLAVRLEMHLDSLIDDDYGSPEEEKTVHEPPRRVLVQPSKYNVSFSDYIFPGEGAAEVLEEVKELLDLEITEEEVNSTVEDLPDLVEFYKTTSSNEGEESLKEQRSQLPSKLIVAFVSFLVLLIALLIALKFQ